jgi:hypothetical protein
MIFAALDADIAREMEAGVRGGGLRGRLEFERVPDAS